MELVKKLYHIGIYICVCSEHSVPHHWVSFRVSVDVICQNIQKKSSAECSLLFLLLLLLLLLLLFFIYVFFATRTWNNTSDFEPWSKLEDLNLDVKKNNSKDSEEQYATNMLSRRYSQQIPLAFHMFPF